MLLDDVSITCLAFALYQQDGLSNHELISNQTPPYLHSPRKTGVSRKGRIGQRRKQAAFEIISVYRLRSSRRGRPSYLLHVDIVRSVQ